MPSQAEHTWDDVRYPVRRPVVGLGGVRGVRFNFALFQGPYLRFEGHILGLSRGLHLARRSPIMCAGCAGHGGTNMVLSTDEDYWCEEYKGRRILDCAVRTRDRMD